MARKRSEIKPEYSKRDVNRAAEILLDTNTSQEQKDEALIKVNNWRASHNYPLNTFQARLRSIAKSINLNSFVAQRIKRLISIKSKLEKLPNMKLAQIQDIGGCRAIMKDMQEVDRMVDIYLNDSRGVKHKLARMDDYIANPKPTGYRGVHLIYNYHSEKAGEYNDMKIEIQIRTLIQHAWATAVETVDTFTGQSLKSNDQGTDTWKRFFVLMSSAMAIGEGKPTVANTSDNLNDLIPEIIRLEKELKVIDNLNAFRHSMDSLFDVTPPNTRYYLLILNPDTRKIEIRTYTKTQYEVAVLDYNTIEKQIRNDNRNVVLVSADSIDELKKAFPNYYLDTELFLVELERVINTYQLKLF